MLVVVYETALQALRLMNEGHSVPEIARRLGLSEHEAHEVLEKAVQNRDAANAFWNGVRKTAEFLWAERKAGRFDSTKFIRPVLSRIGGALRSEGFRRKGAKFCRDSEQGVLQTVAVNTGLAYPTGPSLEYGHFSVDLLVDLDDILLLDSFPQDNHPRQEIGPRQATAVFSRLGADWHDMWWPMTGDPATASDDAVEKLVSEGVPFLNRFGSRALIERELTTSAPGTFARSVPVLLAALQLRRQDFSEAHRILAEYLAGPDVPPPHRQWLERYVHRLAEL